MPGDYGIAIAGSRSCPSVKWPPTHHEAQPNGQQSTGYVPHLQILESGMEESVFSLNKFLKKI